MKLLDIVTGPWAIEPAKLLEIQAIYATHLRGEKIDLEAVEKRIGRPLANESRGYEIRDGVAVLPVDGVLAKRMNLFSQISGGASYEIIGRDFAQALADPQVEAIALVIDSPGGAVDGVQQLAAQIRSARGIKPVGAIADGAMASAAYWLGAQADVVMAASATTVVGSIGVVFSHTDVSGQQEKAGLKTTEITAGKYKRIASQYGALTDEGRADMQAKADYIYEIFVGDVAQARGVSVEKVLGDMADGRVFIGQQAVAAGLVDGVSTLDGLIANLKQRAAGVAAKPAGASMDIQTLKAEHPELVQAIVADGATAERERILAVEAQALPGHEALIARLKADGKTTGPEAAAQVLAAERQKLTSRASALAADAPAPVAFAAAPAAEAASGDDDTSLPVEERAKSKWDASADIRKEFGSVGAYTAYLKNHEAGRARVFGK